MTPILILAAGRSSRMGGRDKLAEPVGGVPLLRQKALAALATGEPVFAALPGPDHPRAALLDGLTVTRLYPAGAAEGMGGSLRDSVAALPPCGGFLLLLADLPEIDTSHLNTLLAAPDKRPGALIWHGSDAAGNLGHPVLFDSSLRPEFATLGGDIGARPIVRAHKDRLAVVTLPGTVATRDLDTPEDWAAWRAETGL
jgi:CTP:molybdopterin cytidylyltransferase MocA